MPEQINITEARINLSKILDQVRAGEEIIIADDFDAPLPDDIL